MEKVYYFREDLRNVTEYYYNIILSALRSNSCMVIETNWISFKEIPRSKSVYVLVTRDRDLLKLFLSGFRNFIFWFQGIGPEERFMMNGYTNKLKYYFNSMIECLALRKSKYKIVVSKYQKEHYVKKYHLNEKKHVFFIMPCYNSEIHKNSFFVEKKYEQNIFCYAGGMQIWQGFDLMLSFYKEIEKMNDNVCLRIYSKDVEQSKAAIKKYKIKNWSVECLSPKDLDVALSHCKFGFILREDNVVNNVATPTKLATYVGNGVIPIYTAALSSYRDLALTHKYLCCVNNVKDINPVLKYLNTKINGEDVYKDFSDLYDGYFNTEKYVQALSSYFTEK